MKAEVTGYWTFFCNPVIWEIDLFLATEKQKDTFQVNEWYRDYVKPGQLGIIRVGIDNRNKKQLRDRQKLSPGIYAIVEIIGMPTMSKDVSNYYVKEEDQNQEKLRVEIRYLKNLLNNPILLKAIKQNPIINGDQYLIDGFQRSTMPLNKTAFEEIINILGTDSQIYSNIEPESIDTIDEIAKLELKYQDAAPQVKEVISKRIERGKISSVIKKLNDYKCKVCEALGQNAYSFKKSNGEHYVETHHIIPVANLKRGSLGISNLITVCANHHREFHYGDIQIVDNTNEQLAISINGQSVLIKKKNFTNV